MANNPFHPERATLLAPFPAGSGPVVYWMQRDQRTRDNWALLYAQGQALERRVPLQVIFCLAPRFLDATLRQYAFMIGGLRQVEEELRRMGIAFHLLCGDPAREIPRHLAAAHAGELVVDFNPLRITRGWIEAVAKSGAIRVVEADAHNIIPCRRLSGKREFGAYTIRPKIRRLLPEFLTPIPRLKKMPEELAQSADPAGWDAVFLRLKIDRSVAPPAEFTPGGDAAMRRLRKFLETKIHRYDADRNDPTKEAQSGLSPYLHFGQISAQRVALEAAAAGGPGADAFLEELIVRRELADNFCLSTPQYDSFIGFLPWGQETLNAHRKDRRTHLYTVERFDAADTHDPLWNAAQKEMRRTGKMHGYMRMYWGKKILEWSRSPEEAVETAIFLNDRYELDGRDPNGYAGIAWSIGGVHDRPWPERPVFGKIRFMNEAGCRRKFDAAAYAGKWGGRNE